MRVTCPGSPAGPRAVTEIVTDDMPFLADSAMAALTRRGRVLRLEASMTLPLARKAAAAPEFAGPLVATRAMAVMA